MDVTVRMYRQGLGDCFLLTFREGDKKFYMLIDCGILQGVKGAAENLTRVAENIAEEVKDHGIDLFVMTHEHWDHISGFCYQGPAKIFEEKIKIKKVWLSHLENPKAPNADKLGIQRSIREKIVREAVAQGFSLGAGNSGFGTWQQLKTLLAFLGPAEIEVAGNLEARDSPGRLVRTGRKARDYIAGLSSDPDKYLEPGKVIKLPEIEGVRIYVLGPPADLGLLGKDESDNPEVIYQNPLQSNNRPVAALPENGDDQYTHEADPSLRPFDEEYVILVNQAEVTLAATDGKAYTDPAEKFFDSKYRLEKNSWRRIDEDWLLDAGELAIANDAYINNSSLALAIELVKNNKVLLFPGDAQVGNWQSWKCHTWKVDDGHGGIKEVKINHLLEKTVFYKVGHHGSHNATLSTEGLGLMTNENLVAMIPVFEEQARAKTSTKNPDGWQMPASELYKHLRKSTRGRVIRSDKGVPEEAECRQLGLAPAKLAEFHRNITCVNDLYIDYRISDD